MQSVDIGQLIRAVSDFAQADPGFEKVTVDVVGSLQPVVGDAELLRIVLCNLFTNSAQAMEGAGTIRVSIEPDGSWCRIVVADEGPGMPSKVRERLFTPFVTTKTRGTGLGLVTSKRIVEAHGGSLHVDWPPSGGTRVIIQLPKPARSG